MVTNIRLSLLGLYLLFQLSVLLMFVAFLNLWKLATTPGVAFPETVGASVAVAMAIVGVWAWLAQFIWQEGQRSIIKKSSGR